MTVTVGHDSAKTRTSLTAGGQTLSYYSIPAADENLVLVSFPACPPR